MTENEQMKRMTMLKAKQKDIRLRRPRPQRRTHITNSSLSIPAKAVFQRCISTKSKVNSYSRQWKKRLSGLKHGVKTQIARLKLQKSFNNLVHGVSL